MRRGEKKEKRNANGKRVKGEIDGVGFELFGEHKKEGPDEVADKDEEVTGEGELNLIGVREKRLYGYQGRSQKSDEEAFAFGGGDFFFEKKVTENDGKKRTG